MSCTAQQTEVNTLRNRRSEQLELLETLPHNAGFEVATEELGRIEADLVDAKDALELCQAQAAQAAIPVPQPISARVDKIECHDASKEVGHDEPYLLIATFDMTDAVNLGVVGVTFPDISVLKIGPWVGVDGGETHYTSALSSANRPDFWGLDSDPRPIAHPQDVIFLVAMSENDGSSPDAIRGAVRTSLLAARAANTNRSYDAYVTAMISNVTPAAPTPPRRSPRRMGAVVTSAESRARTTPFLPSCRARTACPRSFTPTCSRQARRQGEPTRLARMDHPQTVEPSRAAR